MSRTVVAAMVIALLAMALAPAISQEKPPVPKSLPATRPTTQPPRPLPPPMTPEQAAELMAFARQNLPEMHERLVQLQKESPDRARPLLAEVQRLFANVQRFPPGEVRDAAIARHQINLAIVRTARDLKRASAEEKEKISARLRDLLAQQFEQDMIVKEYDLKRLSEQLANLKADLEQRREKRAAIISDRLTRLATRPSADENWD